jgi:WD repeat-containing protein 59
MSFRNPPEGSGYLPALSAPVGHRAILAEVRASLPPMHHLPQPFSGPIRPSGDENAHPVPLGTNHNTGTGTKPVISLNANGRSQAQGGTMSRGNNGGKSVARMDAFTWLSNVKVGGRKESSSGPGSAAGSAGPSRVGSGSRVRSVSPSVARSGEGRRSESVSRSGAGEESGSATVRRESDAGQSLQDEYVF